MYLMARWAQEFALSIWCFFGFCVIYAQNSPPLFENLGSKDGLKPSFATTFVQGPEGLVWIGTNNGLYRYDGVDFVSYRSRFGDFQSLSDNYITCLSNDPSGDLWVGTYSAGLNRFDPSSGLFKRYSESQNRKRLGIQAIFSDSEGGIWVGTGGGLLFYDRKVDQLRSVSLIWGDKEELSNSVSAIREVEPGILWLGTNRGILIVQKVEDGVNVVENKPDGFELVAALNVNNIYRDSVGLVWVGTSKGLFVYQSNKKRLVKAESLFPYYDFSSEIAFTSFSEGSKDGFWLGTDEGVIRFDRKSGLFRQFKTDRFNEHSLSSDEIGALFLDKSGVMWIGTYGGGISTFSFSRQMFNLVTSFPHIGNSLSAKAVSSIDEDRRGMIWIGCQGSINLLDPKTGRIYRHAMSAQEGYYLGSSIRAVFHRENGDFLIGSSKGLSLYDSKQKKFESVKDFDGVEKPPHTVSDIVEDETGRLWLATSSGLFCQNPGLERFEYIQLKQFREDPVAAGSVNAYKLHVDSEGRIWVGTLREGLYYQKEAGVNAFVNVPPVTGPGKGIGLSHEAVVSFVELSEREMWVGTYGGGINRLVLSEAFDITSIEYYTEADGLPDNNICGILSDSKGRLWLSSGSGIARLNPETKKVTKFDSRDGLQGEDFQAGAALKSKEGVLYFGGDLGMNYFEPKNIRSSDYDPRIVLTDLLVFNKSVALKNELLNVTKPFEFTHRQSVITLKFAALDYNLSSKIRYEYKMSKYSDEWLPTNENRSVTFTELAPGSYQLRVRATNHHGVWSKNELVLRIISKPPFYRTWWAYSFYVFFGVSTATALIKKRESNYKIQIQKREQELLNEKLVADRLKRVDKIKDEILANTSHELRTPLNGMIGLAKSMLDGVTGNLTFDQRDNLLMIVSSGIRLNNLVNDILDFSKMVTRELELNLSSQDVHSSVSMVLNLSKHLIGDKDVSLINGVPGDCPYVLADNDRLQQILYNLVGNAIKFTERGSVSVGARRDGEFLWIDVRDTGIGINADQFERIFQSFEQGDGSTSRKFGGTGLGLAVTKQLIELQNGEIQVNSEVGEGSCFSVRLPISSVPLSEYTLPGLETVSKVNNLDVSLEEEAMMRSRDFEMEITGDGIFKILVVDDNAVNQRVLVNRLVLERKFTIFKASSGSEALEIIFSEIPPDLVLLDIMMPEQSGYEVCKRVREEFSADELPILLVTAKNQVGDLVEGFDAGANDFLTKPISQEELISRVNVHLKMLELHRNLIASNEKLVHINRNLDQLVNDRTQELELSNIELETLDKIVQVINQETDLPSLLATILSQGFQIFPQAQRAKFWMADGGKDEYRPVAWAGKGTEKVPALVLSFDELDQRYVREEDHAHEDVYITSNTKLRDVPERMRDLPLSKASIVLVMVIDERKPGFLVFENDHDANAFNDIDARKLFRLRGHVLSALDKARTLQELQHKNDAIIKAQKQMVTQAKLASLGALTAGIAHEIRNPLNFINNFSVLSISLAEELKENLAEHMDALDEATIRDINDLVSDLEENASRISHHGHRAEDIVQRMLDHSRTGVGEKQLKELNSLVEESVNFGFHGVISRYPQLNVDLERLYDPQVGQVEVMSNDISRVIINMVENSCYALREKKNSLGDIFEPRLLVETRKNTDSVDIVIRDNGLGIPKDAVDQIFMPFYTTKPTGDGTGLGLSISYEIVTQGHHGQLYVNSEDGLFTEFIVRLPLQQDG